MNRATRKSNKRLAIRIKQVSEQMRKLGEHMNYYGGFGPTGTHGKEMMRAAATARSWANRLDDRSFPESYHYPLFIHMADTHNLILLNSEMDEIMRVCRQIEAKGNS